MTSRTPRNATAAAPSPAKSARKVLLALRADAIDPRLLSSAHSLCQRMDAELEILLLAAGDAVPAAVDAFIRELRNAGLAYSLSRKPSLRRRDIVRHANTHECVAAVVIDSLEAWEAVAEDRASNPWAKLACPLVTAVPHKK